MTMTHPHEDLTAFVDGALPPERAAEVARHLDACEACRAEKARLGSAIAALGALPPAPEPSPFFETRLAARLAREGKPEARLLSRLSALRWKLAAPAVAGVLAASVVVVAVRARRAEERALADHLDLLLDYEAVASVGDVETPEDAAVVAVLDDLDAREGAP